MENRKVWFALFLLCFGNFFMLYAIYGVNTKIEGFIGEVGPMGLQGIQGLQGIPGVDGTNGTIGPPGIRGEQGLPGPQGEIGDPDFSWIEMEVQETIWQYNVTSPTGILFDHSFEVTENTWFIDINITQGGRSEILIWKPNHAQGVISWITTDYSTQYRIYMKGEGGYTIRLNLGWPIHDVNITIIQIRTN